MAVALDAFNAGTNAIGNMSWTHTPVGTPRAVVVHVFNHTGGPAQVTSVTYGGVAMTEVTGSPLIKSTGEAMVVQSFFLGASILTGAQTVQVNQASTSRNFGRSITYTAAADCEIVDIDATISNDSVANPSATVGLLGRTSAVNIGFVSGHIATTSVTPLSGWTSQLEQTSNSRVDGVYTYDTISTADVTVGWTQTADDALAIAFAVSEVSAGSTANTAAGTTTTGSLSGQMATVAAGLATASASSGLEAVATGTSTAAALTGEFAGAAAGVATTVTALIGSLADVSSGTASVAAQAGLQAVAVGLATTGAVAGIELSTATGIAATAAQVGLHAQAAGSSTTAAVSGLTITASPGTASTVAVSGTVATVSTGTTTTAGLMGQLASVAASVATTTAVFVGSLADVAVGLATGAGEVAATAETAVQAAMGSALCEAQVIFSARSGNRGALLGQASSHALPRNDLSSKGFPRNDRRSKRRRH